MNNDADIKMSWLDRKKEEYKEDFKQTFLSLPPKKVAMNLILIFLGSVLLAFATSFFLIPGNIVMGGNSGIALTIMEIIKRSTNNNYPSWIDTDFIILLLTIFFFVLAFILLGFSSLIKNSISAITYPSFVFIFTAIRNVESFHYLRIEEYMSSYPNPVIGSGYDPLAVSIVAAVFGGVFMGLATSLAFKGGGSAGGTTCLVVYFSKHTKMKANTVSIIIDIIIIAAGMFAYMDIITTLIGIMAAVICSQIIAKVFVGGSQVLHAEIISSHWENISHAIHTKMRRGTTIYTAQGGYTGVERKVVYASFTKEEYQDFLKIVNDEDPSAFITITNVYDVSGGYGFAKKRNKNIKEEPKLLDTKEKIEENKDDKKE